MNFGRLLAVGGWLMLGVGVVGISMWEGQREAVWGKMAVSSEAVSDLVLSDHHHAGSEILVLTNQLPPVEILPNDWRYPVKAAHDWLWWRMADSEQEKANRWLYLANERLRAGWELCHQEGEMNKAVETLTKAEGYLDKALLLASTNGYLDKEVLITAQIHHQLLKEMENHVPEELRPRVTELLNVSGNKLAQMESE